MKSKLLLIIVFSTCVLFSKAQVEISSGGIATAYTLSVPGAFSLRAGIQVTFKANVVCSTPVTMDVNSSGAILIKKEGGLTNIVANDIRAGQVVNLAYDGTNWQMLSATGNTIPISNSVWSITGNTSTVDGTNYIGTFDNIPFNIRVNNQKAGRIDPTLSNTFFGYQAANTNSTGNYNSAFGYQALYSNSTGAGNTATGNGALYSNNGSFNTATGYNSLYNNTASNNTAYGYQSATNNIGGQFNTALGQMTLYTNSAGNENSASGYRALYSNTASYNTAFGSFSAFTNLSGQYNTAIGGDALRLNSTGGNNTAVGHSALYSNTSVNNTSVGYLSMYANTGGSENTAAGMEALRFNLTGSNNSAFGRYSLYNATAGSNTAIGYAAGYTTTNGTNNSFLGSGADASLGSLTNATAIGANAIVGASNSLVLGGTGGNAVKVGVSTTTPLTSMDVNGAYSARFFSAVAANTIVIPVNVTLFRITSLAGVQSNVASVATPVDGQFLTIFNEDGDPASFGTYTIPATNGISSFVYDSPVAAWKMTSTNSAAASGAWAIGGNAPAGASILGTTDNSALTIQTGIGALNFGTDAASKTITLGNTTGATALNINTGTGGSTYTTTNATFSLNTGTGSINFGTDAAAKIITIGNSTGGTSLVLNSGTGALNIGTNAVAHTVAIGNATTTSTTNILSGSGAINLNASNNQPTNINTGTSTGAVNIGNASNSVALPKLTTAGIVTNSAAGVLGTTAVISVTNGGTGATAFTQGSMVFAGVGGVYAQDNANLFWDNTSKRLGIGTTTPPSLLSVHSTTSAQAVISTQGTGVASDVDLNLVTMNNAAGSLAIGAVGTKGWIMGARANAWSVLGEQNDFFISGYDGTIWNQVFNIDMVNKFVGIGTNTPTELLYLRGGDADIDAETNSAIESSSVHFLRSRGTAAVPTVPVISDYFGQVEYKGWDGTAFQLGAMVQGVVDGTPGAADMPGRLEFYTTPDGSATSLSRMTIKNNGNVGIGTTTPTEQLTISSNSGGIVSQTIKSYNTSAWGNSLAFQKANGTATVPTAVASGDDLGYIDFYGYNSANASMQVGASIFAEASQAYTTANYAGSRLVFSTAPLNTNTPTQRMTILNNGFVGIGILTPLAPLHVATVAGATSFSATNTYFNSATGVGAAPIANLAAAAPVIRADGHIWSSGGAFVASSDQRIKINLGISNSQNDLFLVSQLKVTDYLFKDSLEKGNQILKGFIAQEVEKIVPEAVTKQTNWIPDIYQVAEHLEYNEQDKTLTVFLKSLNDLKVGDKIKLISTENSDIQKEVIAVNENCFTIGNWTEKTDKLFVFGKEVNDFRVVDYDRLFTVGISAIQELIKRETKSKAEFEDLKKQFEYQQNQNQQSESRLNQFEKENVSLKSDLEKIKAQLGIDLEVKK